MFFISHLSLHLHAHYRPGVEMKVEPLLNFFDLYDITEVGTFGKSAHFQVLKNRGWVGVKSLKL